LRHLICAAVGAAKKNFDDVRAATIQMNNDVLDYLVAVARGQQQ
jgi:hypothetical protein